jgi:hypothetical protein
MDDVITQGSASGRSQLELALALARAGQRVLPVLLTPLGPTYATTDAEQIRAWWGHWPDALIAVDLPGVGLMTPDPHGEGAMLPHQLKLEFEQALAKIGHIVWGTNEQGGYNEPCELHIQFELVSVDPEQIIRKRRRN